MTQDEGIISVETIADNNVARDSFVLSSMVLAGRSYDGKTSLQIIGRIFVLRAMSQFDEDFVRMFQWVSSRDMVIYQDSAVSHVTKYTLTFFRLSTRESYINRRMGVKEPRILFMGHTKTS